MSKLNACKLKIFFTASYYGKEKFQRYYDLVLRKIEEGEVEVIGTEKGNYLELVNASKKKQLGYRNLIHYEAIRRGILWSDAVIIEMSKEDFQLGHEATLAIQSKKHVLCLSVNEDFSKKIKNKFFHGSKYNEYNVGEVIRNFLTEVRGKQYSERFNCFLSKKQLEYLKGAGEKKKMNKSEYLRNLIEIDMKGR
ncbi:MAG: hypothetical protein PHS44_00895 [Candidatus Dojkabacteria bacterium]|nr:hypothetical protein [Candidatus Dojkabacteria bacterium]